MASTQSSANKAHYESSAAIVARGPLTREEQIEWNDIHWTALTAEPGGLAEWVRPKLGLVGQSCQAMRR
jgi:hypothetical protein